jgi:hypothetical protein
MHGSPGLPYSTYSQRREFHLEEYRQLRTELLALLSRLDTLLQYAVLASTFVYAWICANTYVLADAHKRLPPEIALTALALPPIAVVLLGAIAWSTWMRIKALGTYLGNLESDFGFDQLGWEQRRTKHRKYRRSLAGPVTIAVWVILALACLAASYILYFNVPKG